jgi:hypothetical protein
VPAGIPAQLSGRFQQLIHDVFVNGYVVALRPTVGVAVVVLAVAALSCILLVNRRYVSKEVAAPVDAAAVA